jgi:hypothetical protein
MLGGKVYMLGISSEFCTDGERVLYFVFRMHGI